MGRKPKYNTPTRTMSLRISKKGYKLIKLKIQQYSDKLHDELQKNDHESNR